jgi:hypothetical protein
MELLAKTRFSFCREVEKSKAGKKTFQIKCPRVPTSYQFYISFIMVTLLYYH